MQVEAHSLTSGPPDVWAARFSKEDTNEFRDDDAMPTLRHGITADCPQIDCRNYKTSSQVAALVIKILLSVNRVRLDLLKTMEEETVSGAAWNARNLLELWVWA